MLEDWSNTFKFGKIMTFLWEYYTERERHGIQETGTPIRRGANESSKTTSV